MSEERFTRSLMDRLNAAGATVSPQQINVLRRYYELLRHWNRRVNLTALPLDDYPPPTMDRLLVEPIVAAQLVDQSSDIWFDLGSGGGSPAIPLKIIRPALLLTMVEAKGRKAAFLRVAVRELPLDGARVLTVRAEHLPQEEQGSASLVTVRGVRIEEPLLRDVRQLLKERGRLLVFGWEKDQVVPQFELIQRLVLPGGSHAVWFERRS